MADPLSLTASVIAVATLAAKTASTISTLRAINQLPGRLHAICNEVADLELVLRHIALVLSDRSISRSGERADALLEVINKAEHKLDQLDNVVKRVKATCVGNGMFFVRAKAWILEKPRLQVLQEDLRTIKANLNIMLGATHM
jgi:hypothetical protein